MPLYKKEVTEESIWGIWKIEETPSELLEALQSKEEIAPQLKQYNTVKRQTEFLALRVLLQELGGDPCQVEYEPSGRPFLFDQSFQISFTHTRDYAAVYMHRTASVGIDMEYPSSRIFKVRSKFMHPDEESALDLSEEEKALLLHWSAKETLFKAINEEEADFKGHLHIRPFKVQPEGVIEAYETRTLEHHSFDVFYQVTDSFVLTRTILKEKE
jgi:4'-phosphopantetheinyl transferase